METTTTRISVAVLASIIAMGVACNTTAIVSLIRLRRWKFLQIVLVSMFASNLLGASLGYALAMTELYADSYADPSRCKFDAFLVMWTAVASIYHVVALCLYRMFQLAKPLQARVVNRKTRPAVWTISISWLASMLLCFPPLVGWGNFIKVPNLRLCGLDYYTSLWSNRLYLGVAVFFGFLFPLILNVCGYALMLGKRQPRKFNLMESAMLAAFFVSWTPYAVISVMAMSSERVGPGTELACTFVAKASNIYNPIIYMVRHRIYKFWRCRRRAKKCAITAKCRR